MSARRAGTRSTGSSGRRTGSARALATLGVLVLGALVVAALRLLLSPTPSATAAQPSAAVPDLEPTGIEPAELARGLAPGRRAQDERPSSPDIGPARKAPVLPALIHGHVLTAENLPPPSARVCARRSGWTSGMASIEPDGSFELVVDAGHSYQVLVDKSSLPDGYLEPALQDQGVPGSSAPGYYATEVAIPPEGGTFEVTLRVFVATIVRGRIVGPHGEPVPNCWVRVQDTRPDRRGIAATGYADEAGFYELADCRPASSCLVQVNPLTSTNEGLRLLAVPMPLAIEVPEGEDLTIQTIRLGAGPNGISGRVVDQWGEPWADLPVRVYSGDWLGTLVQTRTDEHGRFHVAGLDPAQVKVQIAEEYRVARRAIGTRNPRWFSPPIPLDLRSPETRYDLGTITLAASEPYFFEGTLVLDETFATEREIELDDLRIQLSWLAEPAPGERAPGPWAETLVQPDYDKKTGRLRWSCETPHPPVRMTVSARIIDPPEVVVDLTPQPNRLEERSIRYP
jgi:hypothetical protein